MTFSPSLPPPLLFTPFRPQWSIVRIRFASKFFVVLPMSPPLLFYPSMCGYVLRRDMACLHLVLVISIYCFRNTTCASQTRVESDSFSLSQLRIICMYALSYVYFGGHSFECAMALL